VEINVTGEAPLVQQANATVQYSINQKALDELPISNQSASRYSLSYPAYSETQEASRQR
jgi:hypothetical protein